VKERLEKEDQLSEYQAEVIASDRRLSLYYQEAVKGSPYQSTVANYLINDFLATEPDLSQITLPAQHFATVAEQAESGKINSKQAKQILQELFSDGGDPLKIIAEKGLSQMSGTEELEPLCQAAIDSNPKSVEDYRSGKTAAINALKGFVMKQTKGKANPQVVDEILAKLLSS